MTMINSKITGNEKNQAPVQKGKTFDNKMLGPDFKRSPGEFLKILKEAFPEAKEEGYTLSSVSKLNKAIERLEKSLKQGRMNEKDVNTIVQGIDSLYAICILKDANSYILAKAEPEIKEIVKEAGEKHEVLMVAADMVLEKNKCQKISELYYVSEMGLITIDENERIDTAHDDVKAMMEKKGAPMSETGKALELVRSLENLLELKYEYR